MAEDEDAEFERQAAIELEAIKAELQQSPYVVRVYSVDDSAMFHFLSILEDEEMASEISGTFCDYGIEGDTIQMHAEETPSFLGLIFDADSFEDPDLPFAAFAMMDKYPPKESCPEQPCLNSMYLDIICTSEKSREAKKQYGTILLQAIEKYAKKRGFTHIELDALSGAVEFYKKVGYTEIPNNNSSNIWMRKSLELTGGKRLRLKTIRRSHNKEKKWDAVFEKDGKEKVVPFGQKGYSDFTKHKDTKRRQRYIERHSGMGEDWSDPTTPGALSRYILWNKKTRKASIADFKKRFHV